MELIDNINRLLGDDLKRSLKPGARLKVAASCFSMYAFEALKEELEQVDELCFIFTSPTFVAEEVTDKIRKERKEFHIPKLNRERSLYGSEFEIQLRNKLTQRAIAKECADWMRRKPILLSSELTALLQRQFGIHERTTRGLLRQMRDAAILRELPPGPAGGFAMVDVPAGQPCPRRRRRLRRTAAAVGKAGARRAGVGLPRLPSGPRLDPAQRLALERDRVRAVQQPVHDGVGKRRLGRPLMPRAAGPLARHQRAAAAHPVVQQFPQILPILLADRRDGQVVEHQHVQPRQLRQLRQSRVARLCPACGYGRRLAPQLPPGTVHLGGDRPANQARSSLGTGLAVAEPGNRAPTTRSGSIRKTSAHSDDTSVSRPRVGLRSRPS